MSSPAKTQPSTVRSDREYEYWRWRILIGTMIGYIFFYFVRKSITMAMPGLESIGGNENDARTLLDDSRGCLRRRAFCERGLERSRESALLHVDRAFPRGAY